MSEFEPRKREASGLDIKGAIPPALAKAIEEQATQTPIASAIPTTESAPTIRPPMFNTAAQTSSRLEELIKSIQQKTIAFEAVRLASKGKFYDGTDGPTDGIVHIRPMTGEEEQILATPRFVRKGQAINMIFQRCIQEKFNVERLLTIDRTQLLIYLRGISYTPDYDVEVKCPMCQRKFQTTIDLNALEVTACADDFTVANLTGLLPTSQLPFQYRLSNGQDEVKVQEYRDRKVKGGFDLSNQPDDSLLFRTALLLDDIGGLTNKQEIQALLKKLPINDLAYLRTAVTEPPFGVKTAVAINCPSCQEEFDIELPLEASFFFPKVHQKKTQA